MPRGAQLRGGGAEQASCEGRPSPLAGSVLKAQLSLLPRQHGCHRQMPGTLGGTLSAPGLFTATALFHPHSLQILITEEGLRKSLLRGRGCQMLNRFSRVFLRPHGLQPSRLLCPWDSPGKNTGVGCHFLLQCMKVKSESEVTQSCPTLVDPMDCSLPGSSIHGIFQARVLEWGAIAFSVLRL